MRERAINALLLLLSSTSEDKVVPLLYVAIGHTSVPTPSLQEKHGQCSLMVFSLHIGSNQSMELFVMRLMRQDH